MTERERERAADRDWRRRDVLRTASSASLALAAAATGAGSAAARGAGAAASSSGRRGAASDARSAQGDAFEQGERVWSFETGGTVESSPTVVDGTVLFGSNDGNLYALDAETGAERWRVETGAPPAPPGGGDGGSKSKPGVKSSPLVVDGTVYFGANDFGIYAVDLETGEEVWREEANRYVWASPAYADGVLYVSSRDEHLYAADAETGELLWRGDLEHPSGASPAVEDGRVHVGSYGEVNFHTFDAATGELLWKKEFDAEHCSAPAVHDGTVYAIFPDRPLYAFDAATGEVQWEFDGEGIADVTFGIDEKPTVWDGTVYVTKTYTQEGLYAVDAETGEQEWHAEAPMMLHQKPTVADGVVYAASFTDTTLYGFDADTGEEVFAFETYAASKSGPMVVDGVVFFGTNDGYLHAVCAAGEGSSEDYLAVSGTEAHHHAWVGDDEPDLAMVAGGDSYEPTDGDFELPYGDWLDDVPNYEGTVDRRGEDRVHVEVGAGEDGTRFDPPAVLVDPSTRVVFEWTGRGGEHNTVEENGLWASDTTAAEGHEFPLRWDTLESGKTSITERDVYRYECVPHADVGMKGAIVVGLPSVVEDDLIEDDGLPGFGIGTGLAALGGAAAELWRRGDGSAEDA